MLHAKKKKKKKKKLQIQKNFQKLIKSGYYLHDNEKGPRSNDDGDKANDASDCHNMFTKRKTEENMLLIAIT